MAEWNVVDAYLDADAHRSVSETIKRHSSNQSDIREVALEGLDLGQVRKVVDLGCGFGFFTEALRGKVQPQAEVLGLDVIEDYRLPFLDVCRKADFRGKFLSDGAPLIKTFPPGEFDLVLCSFSLYFFPELIGEIARVLRKDGRFIVITHHRYNMKELVRVTKAVLAQEGISGTNELPIEDVIHKFHSENGLELLSPYFEKIRPTDYPNFLHFGAGDLPALLDYFAFKTPLFFFGTDSHKDDFLPRLKPYLEQLVTQEDGITISKDDTIFICTGPLPAREDP